MEALKTKYFNSHPDEPIVFHRKELTNKNYPFQALRDPEIDNQFGQEFMTCLRRWNFVVITVTIDKLQHLQRYRVWHHHQYHYCLEVLIERYVMWLVRKDATGDVVAESRGKREDNPLIGSFNRLHRGGTDYVTHDQMRERLVQDQLWLATKDRNVAGLQLADPIAYPSFRLRLLVVISNPYLIISVAQLHEFLRR